MLPRQTSPSLFAYPLLFLALIQTTFAHFQITYPGWRANSLHDDQQWLYPCAGEPVTTNRTKWPLNGGAVSVIPGWNAGHPTSFFYINMGFGSDPPNMTNVMHSVFQSTGPSKNPFSGSFCLPFVPLPANTTVSVGDNATIQVIQVALHGASLYNCADITFVEPQDADPIPDNDCTNSTDIGFNLVYTTTSGASEQIGRPTVAFALLAAVVGLLSF